MPVWFDKAKDAGKPKPKPKPKRVVKRKGGFAGAKASGAAGAAAAGVKPRPKPKAKAKPLGGRAVHDVAATADAVSRGKPVPKPTVKPKPKTDAAAGLGKTAKGTVKVKKKGGGKLGVVRVAAVATPALAALDAVKGAEGAKQVLKFGGNAAKDAYELGVTLPSSLAHLASTAAHDPEKVPGLLAEPYKELARDPVKFATQRPVSTALMVAPGVRVPGRVAGKAARVAGKQTLRRPTATVPGTALKEVRKGSRDAFVNAAQKRADRKNPQPVMKDHEVQRRVDEFFDYGQQHKILAHRAASKDIRKRVKRNPALSTKQQRQAAIDAHMKGTSGGAQKKVDRQFGEEFGATWTVHPKHKGTVVKTTGSKGHLHTSKADAQRVADVLNKRNPGRQFTVHEAGARWAVVPEAAKTRLGKQQAVGSAQATGSKVMRVAGRSFRGAVLPLSAKWLTGQATEAVIRSAVAGAGPTSLVRGVKVLRATKKLDKAKGRELQMRTTRGGQFDVTGTAREWAQPGNAMGETLADAFSDTRHLARPAAALTRAGSKAGARHVRAGWKTYSNVVFEVVNGAIERTARTAMLGKAVKQSPLMERRIVTLSDKAIHEAAQGLRATENQVQLARAVDRMYGQYSKFSAVQRETLLHTTPFYPWYRNMAEFLTRVLPGDHPVKAALAADISTLEEEWRRSKGLSTLADEGVRPAFLLGGYPAGKGGDQTIRIGRYGPALPADITGAAADLVLPQFSGGLDALKNLEFTGNRLVKDDVPTRELPPKLALAALTGMLEAHVPGVGPAGRVTGLTDRYGRGKKDEPTVLDGKDIVEALKREYNPVAPTKAQKKKLRKKAGGALDSLIEGGGGDGSALGELLK